MLSSLHPGEGEDTMDHWRLVAGCGLIAALTLGGPVSVSAQLRGSDLALTASQSRTDDTEQIAPAPPLELDPSRVEFSLGVYVGRPGGYIRVGENGDHGRRLRLNDDLNVGASEAAEAAVAFHFTPPRSSITSCAAAGSSIVSPSPSTARSSSFPTTCPSMPTSIGSAFNTSAPEASPGAF